MTWVDAHKIFHCLRELGMKLIKLLKYSDNYDHSSNCLHTTTINNIHVKLLYYLDALFLSF